MEDATAAGRGYGVAGGVASAIEKCINTFTSIRTINHPFNHHITTWLIKNLIEIGSIFKKVPINYVILYDGVR